MHCASTSSASCLDVEDQPNDNAHQQDSVEDETHEQYNPLQLKQWGDCGSVDLNGNCTMNSSSGLEVAEFQTVLDCRNVSVLL